MTVRHSLTVEGILQAHRSVEPTEVLVNRAALARGIAHGHPFSEGNKRTALLAVHLLARLNGQAFIAGEMEAFHLITDLATSRIDVEVAAQRIREHLFTIG